MARPRTETPGRYGAIMRFWPDRRPAGRAGCDQVEMLAGATSSAAAAGPALQAAASLAGLAVARAGGHAIDPMGNGPLSLWRGMDGWLVVDTTTPPAWRDFCATFLNLAAWRGVRAEDAWRTPWTHELATTVLDTHRVDDAVGTCRTYGVPAAVVEGWRDRERPETSKRLADHLAWAVLVEGA